MKELSIEQKAQRYDEAIRKAKITLGCCDSASIITEHTIYDIFPELKEGEDERKDERIRKVLIDYFNRYKEHEECGVKTFYGIPTDDILTWLEKQESVRKIVERCKNSWYNEGKIAGMTEGLTDDEKYQQGWHDALEKQGEQKSAEWHKGDEQNLNACLGYIPDEYLRKWLMDVIYVKYDKPTDKIEPKFKVGDKIRIKTPSSFDKDMEVARIEKDYYLCNHIGKFSSEVVPFSKESSYELVEHKPAWSEEDEHRIDDTIYFIETAKKHYASTVELDACIDWLKSLKDRYVWKPSDEQLDALQYVYRNSNPLPSDKLGWNSLKTLELMYHDLKKLKE